MQLDRRAEQGLAVLGPTDYLPLPLEGPLQNLGPDIRLGTDDFQVQSGNGLAWQGSQPFFQKQVEGRAGKRLAGGIILLQAGQGIKFHVPFPANRQVDEILVDGDAGCIRRNETIAAAEVAEQGKSLIKLRRGGFEGEVGDLPGRGDGTKGPGMQFVVKLVAQGVGRKRQAVEVGHAGTLLSFQAVIQHGFRMEFSIEQRDIRRQPGR